MTRRPPTDLNIVASYYARWSPHEDKRREIADDHKAMFAEAKGDGLNPKALRKAFAEQYRVENQTAEQAEKRNETDEDVELYLSVLARVREDEPEHDAETGEVKESTAARKDVPIATTPPAQAKVPDASPGVAGTQAPPVDTIIEPQAGDGNARPVPVQTVPLAGPVSVSAEQAPVESSASIHDLTKPNPICRDPGDCGVYASWHLPCESCKRAAVERRAA